MEVVLTAPEWCAGATTYVPRVNNEIEETASKATADVYQSCCIIKKNTELFKERELEYNKRWQYYADNTVNVMHNIDKIICYARNNVLKVEDARQTIENLRCFNYDNSIKRIALRKKLIKDFHGGIVVSNLIPTINKICNTNYKYKNKFEIW